MFSHYGPNSSVLLTLQRGARTHAPARLHGIIGEVLFLTTAVAKTRRVFERGAGAKSSTPVDNNK